MIHAILLPRVPFQWVTRSIVLRILHDIQPMMSKGNPALEAKEGDAFSTKKPILQERL